MTRYLAIATLLIAAGHVNAAEKTFERTFAVSSGGTLLVDADSASVEVSGGNTDKVTVRMRANGPEDDLANLKLDAVQRGGEVTVFMKRNKKEGWFTGGSWSVNGDIKVTVPREHRINVRTSGGSVELKDTVGTATLRSSGGDITANSVTGNLEARTSGGGIYAGGIRGDIDVATSGGDLRLIRVDGKITGRTSGGSVRCSLVGQNRGISTRTSGGSIELIVPSATTGRIEATTSGGDVTSDLPVAATRKTENQLAGSINGGGELIDLSTSGGSIAVRAGD